MNYKITDVENIHYPDNIGINSLELADGIKELLTNYEFTLSGLLNIPSSELAEFLDIDRYIAEIIGYTATKLSNIDNASKKLQTKNCIAF